MDVKEVSKVITRNNTNRYYFKIYSIYTFKEFDCSIEVVDKKIFNPKCTCKHGMFQQSKKEVTSYCRHLKCAINYLEKKNIIYRNI